MRVEDFQLDGARVRIIIPEKPLPGKPWLLERIAGDPPQQVARALLEKGVYYVSLAKANVPIIHVCGDSDKTVPYEENTGLFKERYEKAGGRNMTIILKGGMGHWTHGLKDLTPVVEFILRAIGETESTSAITADSARKIWEWSAENIETEWKTVNIDLTPFCKDACVYQVDFNSTGGSPLEIQSLHYVFDGTVLPEFVKKDTPDASRYYLAVTGVGKPLMLRAVVRAVGKKDSWGTVTICKRFL